MCVVVIERTSLRHEKDHTKSLFVDVFFLALMSLFARLRNKISITWSSYVKDMIVNNDNDDALADTNRRSTAMDSLFGNTNCLLPQWTALVQQDINCYLVDLLGQPMINAGNAGDVIVVDVPPGDTRCLSPRSHPFEQRPNCVPDLC